MSVPEGGAASGPPGTNDRVGDNAKSQAMAIKRTDPEIPARSPAPSSSLAERSSSPAPGKASAITPRAEPTASAIHDKQRLLAAAATLFPQEGLKHHGSGSKLNWSADVDTKAKEKEKEKDDKDKDNKPGDDKRKSNFLSKFTSGSVRLIPADKDKDEERRKKDEKERKESEKKEKKEKKERERKDSTPGTFASLRGSKRNQAMQDLVISRPYSFVVKTHVDDQLRWQGEDPAQAFNLEQRIGGGAYGSVYRAVHKSSGYVFAIKCVTLTKSELQELQKEIEILKKCKDINIVQYYGSYLKEDTLWILMDYCAVGSLLDLLRVIKRTLTEQEIAAIMFPVLRGLAYLHKEKIIHRDLKSANILLTEQMEPKIADFGVSAQIGNLLSKAKTVVGTPLFMPPEVLDGASYDVTADIWSIGITAIEAADGYPPHHGENIMRAIMLIVQSPPPAVKDPSHWSDNFNSFISTCCQKEAAKRSSAEQLLNHPFVLSVANAPPSYKPLAHLIDEHRKAKEREREEKEQKDALEQQAKKILEAKQQAQQQQQQQQGSTPVEGEKKENGLLAPPRPRDSDASPSHRRATSVDERQLTWEKDERANSNLLPTEKLSSSSNPASDDWASSPREEREERQASNLVPIEHIDSDANLHTPTGVLSTTLQSSAGLSVVVESPSPPTTMNLPPTPAPLHGPSPLSASGAAEPPLKSNSSTSSAGASPVVSLSSSPEPDARPKGGREGSYLRSNSQPSMKRGSQLAIDRSTEAKPSQPAVMPSQPDRPVAFKKPAVLATGGSHLSDPDMMPPAIAVQLYKDRLKAAEEKINELQMTVNALKEQLIIERADNASREDELKLMLSAIADWKASTTRVEQQLKERSEARQSRRKNALSNK